MATETFFLPGYGVYVDEATGDEVFIPGYGVIKDEAAAGVANPKGPLGHPLHGPFGGPV